MDSALRKQLQRTREYVAVVRMALARERRRDSWRDARAAAARRTRQGAQADDLPRAGADPHLLAAIGPKNTALAGEIADGWIPRCSRPSTSPSCGRCSRRAPRAPGARSRISTSRPPSTCSSPTTSPPPATRCVRSSPCTSAAWARASRTSTTSSSRATALGARPQQIQDLYLEGKREEAMAAIPEALIDTVSLCGPPDVVRERLAVYRDAGVGTLGVTPIALHGRRSPRAAATRRRARRLASGRVDRSGSAPERAPAHPARRLRRPGPRLSDDRARTRAARRAVTRSPCRPGGAGASRRGRGSGVCARARVPGVPQPRLGCAPLDFYEAVVHATRDTLPLVSALRPTSSWPTSSRSRPRSRPRCGHAVGHADPPRLPGGRAPDFPIYSLGARLPRTRAGRGAVAALQAGRRARPRARARASSTARARASGLPALAYAHGGTSRALALVATFPQLEYPRAWPPHAHVVGPLMWEPPAADVELPPGEAPLVLVAPSTAQDPSAPAARTPRCAGLADAPVRVLATWNRRLPSRSLPCPRTRASSTGSPTRAPCPRCDVVVCHAGPRHARARALLGLRRRRLPGDRRHERERRACVDWAGAGVRLPRRFISPRPLRLAVERALGEPAIRARARELAAWAAARARTRRRGWSSWLCANRRGWLSRTPLRFRRAHLSWTRRISK